MHATSPFLPATGLPRGTGAAAPLPVRARRWTLRRRLLCLVLRWWRAECRRAERPTRRVPRY